MSFVADADEFTAKIGGKEYKMAYPTHGQTKKLQAKLKDLGDLEPVDVYADFMVELGLPKDVFEKMSLKNIMALVKYTLDVEKKS
jgi:hypothetical protein